VVCLLFTLKITFRPLGIIHDDQICCHRCHTFAVTFILVVVVAKNRYDAAWMLAIFSIPASSIADRVARLLAGWFTNGQKGILLDLGTLLVFGVVQYGLPGYVLGKMIEPYRR